MDFPVIETISDVYKSAGGRSDIAFTEKNGYTVILSLIVGVEKFNAPPV